MTTPSNPSELMVHASDVRFSWRRGAPEVLALDTLQVTSGERVFIAGRSGSGKSTLLSLLGGVNVPDSGTVTVAGTDLSTLSASARDRYRADNIGFVFQMFNLVPYLSVLDNVTLPCSFSRARSARANQLGGSLKAEARRLLDALELSSDALQLASVAELSIGQQQRVAAARALIGAPPLVIADEPTSALDEGTRERFLQLLFSECEARGTTLLFVSHDTRLGELFDTRLDLADLNKATVQAAGGAKGEVRT